MKKFDWLLIILLLIGVAWLFYRFGRRDEQYATLSGGIADLNSRVDNQNFRIAAIEKVQIEHESRWRFLNRAIDWVRKKLPWC